MYAAAGGASIANRRKQKRLQLNKREGSGAQAAAARARSASAAATGRLPSAGIPTLQLQLPAPAIAAPTYGFHSSHEHHRGRGRRRPVAAGQYDRKSSNSYHHHHHHHHHHNNNNNNNNNNNSHNADHNGHRLLAPPPISPIIQFPISPPPLSLESPSSLYGNGVAQQAPITGKSNGYGNNNSPAAAAVAFPFPPPSFLDLRVSPSTSELQCGGQGPGKAAWQGCARPSPLPLSPASPQGSRGEGYKTKQCEAHRRWMKRNRIRDASYCYGSSGEEDDYEDYEEGVLGADGTFAGRVAGGRRRGGGGGGEVSAAVNTVLYAGLGTTALGLVISFVGTGEKGFLSPELRLVGPSLLCAGLLCCLLRVLLCLCLCRCCGECRWRPCRLARSAKKDSAKQTTGRGKAATCDSAGKANSAAAAAVAAASSGSASASAAGGSRSSNHQQGITATLLPYHPPSTSQRQQPPVPSSSSCSTAKSHKGHELLLSPAQLPE